MWVWRVCGGEGTVEGGGGPTHCKYQEHVEVVGYMSDLILVFLISG